ncbi:hypothetical protein BXZ70DRAFT_1008850 [Cristinia sonorae]|uniref:Uncharacterized protein n=1 Tax=Cristinia sonorae TaxID=1940300 RepID=A0A8K0UNF6_9AGAR|nr:hypothetical protein BXZ70DRAFT_1008850 [Cristinia sonorae]
MADTLPILDISPEFLEKCIALSATKHDPDDISPVCSASTLTDVPMPKIDVSAKKSRYTDNYAKAFSDTYGAFDAPFIYKTGPAWPQRTGGPNAQPYLREQRDVSHTHPIKVIWPDIVKKIAAHFQEVEMQLNIVAGLAFANQGDDQAFCELAVVIGIPRDNYLFASVKTAADHVQIHVLAKAGFSEIPVAIREWEVFSQGLGPKLPSLDPLFDAEIAQYRHLFTSNPGLAVALYKSPWLEGTIGAYFKLHKESDIICGLTCCHVACPSRAVSGLTVAAVTAHHERIIAIGIDAYNKGITDIMRRIGTLQKTIESEEDKIERREQRLVDGTGDPDTAARLTRKSNRIIEEARETMKLLNRLHDDITKQLANSNHRRIGRVYYADPIGAPSDDPAFAHTVDWAFIQLEKDAFKSPFTGNLVYIGDSLLLSFYSHALISTGGEISEEEYGDLMFPWGADKAHYKYPKDGLLQISGHVPEDEMLNPMQRDTTGIFRMPVIKNGMKTGTTVGWLNGLESLVRHYQITGVRDISFMSMETTIVPYGGRGAFSAGGDSGSSILDRRGRLVALLTGGAGLTDKSDITFATPAYKLLADIEKAVPGAFLFPAV